MRARSFSSVTGLANALPGVAYLWARVVRAVVGEAFVAFRPIPTTEMYSFDMKWLFIRMPQILV